MGLGALVRRVRAKGEAYVLSKIMATAVRKIAEGDFGEPLKRVYWWLAGKKTTVGLAFGAAWALLEWGSSSGVCSAQGWDCAGWSGTLATVAMILVGVGLYDGAIRSKAPDKSAGVVLLLLCLLPLAGCATGQFRLGGEPRPLGPDPEVVEQLVCSGQDAEAARYIELRAGSQADRIELVERARRAVSGRPGCCAEGKCQGGK